MRDHVLKMTIHTSVMLANFHINFLFGFLNHWHLKLPEVTCCCASVSLLLPLVLVLVLLTDRHNARP